MTDLIAVVLAGGIGKRLWPVTTHKCLLPFFGKPLISQTLDSLGSAGIKNIVIVANPQNIQDLRLTKLKGTKITLVIQEGHRGMAEALLAAAPQVNKRPILVVNAADIVDASLFTSLVKMAKDETIDGVIPGLVREEHFPGGYLRVDQNRVVEIVEKPEAGKEPSKLVNLVAHYFKDSTHLLEVIAKTADNRDDRYEQALSSLFREKRMNLLTYKGTFASIKYPWDILEIAQILLRKTTTSQVSQSASIHPSAVIEDPLIIEDGAKILEHAVVKGPAYIGKSTIIGTHSLILESLIEEGCVVGFTSEVTRSYLGKACWLHQNYIGDSVLEGENFLGAGAVTANFRFDKQKIFSPVHGEKLDTGRNKFGTILGRGARVGVNSSLMPGVKIGAKAIIGPGVVQYTDLKAETQVLSGR